MTPEPVLQLFPLPGGELPLHGLYLAHDVRSEPAVPFVYSNYVTSLDGRIAVPHPTRPGLTVPQSIANDRDWRLFQELAVQADILFTSGRYLRDYADGRAQEILRVHDDARFADLAAWRKARGLSPQPDLAVISAGLDFPVPDALTAGGRRVKIITVEEAKPERRARLANRAEVIVAGRNSVGGREMVAALVKRGYRVMYNATGPRVLHTILADGLLNRLYLTTVGRLLGGRPFSSVVEGDLLQPPADFRLRALYLDRAEIGGSGQVFASYDFSG